MTGPSPHPPDMMAALSSFFLKLSQPNIISSIMGPDAHSTIAVPQTSSIAHPPHNSPSMDTQTQTPIHGAPSIHPSMNSTTLGTQPRVSLANPNHTPQPTEISCEHPHSQGSPLPILGFNDLYRKPNIQENQEPSFLGQDPRRAHSIMSHVYAPNTVAPPLGGADNTPGNLDSITIISSYDLVHSSRHAPSV